MTYRTLLAEADRMWEAAWTLDALRGDTAASEWTAGKVRELMRASRADDPAAIAALADALEAKLGRESERERVSTGAAPARAGAE